MSEPSQEAEAIARTAREAAWGGQEATVAFLAAGEYNRNYTVETAGRRYVFRINTDTQLGIEDQIEYEFSVLEAVAPSGYTPRPVALGERSETFPRGYLVMEWLPGKPLDYARDYLAAAELFAGLHALNPPAKASRELIRQANPIADIVAESRGLLDRYPDHPMKTERAKLHRYGEKVARLAERLGPTMADERMMVVNTEVNSGNFLVSPEAIYLVDWEKAVVSQRYQDLGHFLVITTTRWKSDYVFSPEARRDFLQRYARALEDLGETPPPMEQLDELTAALEATIVLRGVSWCYMAYYQYTETDRPIRNEHTFNTIRTYLSEIDELTSWVPIS